MKLYPIANNDFPKPLPNLDLSFAVLVSFENCPSNVFKFSPPISTLLNNDFILKMPFR